MNMRSAQSQPDFHLLVIGGGMVGATLAALAASQRQFAGLRIGLLEAHPPSAPPQSDEQIELRVSAISRASQNILQRSGAWALIAPEHRCAYEDMRVWDGAGTCTGPGAIHFSAAATGEPDLGHIIENRRVRWASYDCPAFRQGVTLLRGELAGLEFGEQACSVGLQDGRQLTAALVVGSDGAGSRSRQLAGLACSGHAYPQNAFVTHVRTARPHQYTAWQRFLPTGPLAFLPLTGGRSSIVWSTTPEHAQALVTATEQQVGDELSQAMQGLFGEVQVVGPRGQFPLRLNHAREYCRERFVLVGDAAHAIHPLAGQGVNLGMLDAAALLDVLGAALERGVRPQALGELRVLRRYERWRKSENALALGLVDGLQQVFASRSQAVGWVRRQGLGWLDRSSVAKRALLSRAMGIGGEPPTLAR